MADITVTTNSGKYLTFAQLESISNNSAEHAKTTNVCFWLDTYMIKDPIVSPRYDDVNTYEWPINLEFKYVDRMRVRIILSPNYVAWLDMTVEEFNALDSKDIYTEANYEKCTCKEGETCHKGRSNLINLDDYDEFYNIIVGGHIEFDENLNRAIQQTMSLE